jgi:hypothetical protein
MVSQMGLLHATHRLKNRRMIQRLVRVTFCCESDGGGGWGGGRGGMGCSGIPMKWAKRGVSFNARLTFFSCAKL